MKKIFGTGIPKAPSPTLNDAIIGIESRGETIEKKIEKLDAEIDKYRTQMKKMPEGPSKNILKQKALRCMKQRKVFEQQSEQLANQSFTLGQANFAIETVKDTKATVSAMKSTVKTFKKEMKNLDITKIEDLYDNMADMNDEINDLQEILGQPMGMPDIDENELEAELEALGAEMDFEKDAKFLDEAFKIPGLPSSIPTNEPGAVRSKDVPVDEFGLPKIPEKL